MPELKVGDTFPEGVTFSFIELSPETSDITSCGIPQKYDVAQGMFEHSDSSKQSRWPES